MEYGKNKKRFVFYLSDDDHARFLIKLQELNLKKATIVRDFINALLNDDPNINKWLEGELSAKLSKRTLAVRKREAKKRALQNSQFNLENADVSEIFDILAEAENE
jgi:Zn-dependent oligopeptidase